MPRNKDKKDDLDTQTTIANMNVEGMDWYDPTLKEGEERPKVSKKERKMITKGMFLAYLPFFLMVAAIFGVLFLIAWLWLT